MPHTVERPQVVDRAGSRGIEHQRIGTVVVSRSLLHPQRARVAFARFPSRNWIEPLTQQHHTGPRPRQRCGCGCLYGRVGTAYEGDPYSPAIEGPLGE